MFVIQLLSNADSYPTSSRLFCTVHSIRVNHIIKNIFICLPAVIRIRIRIHRIHMFLGLPDPGSGSGSISQRHGSADTDPDLDPDPHQNVMDPEHCLPDNGLLHIVSERTGSAILLQNGTGTGIMVTVSTNVSAFMVLPKFLPPTSGTFFLMGASHIRPSFERLIWELNNVTGFLTTFTGSVSQGPTLMNSRYFDDF
jgi:hypothetical protein